MTVEITLPFPVSLNNAFSQTSAGRRFKSKRYARWQDQAGWMIKVARLQPMVGPVKVAVALHAKDRRRRDADNLIKPVVDSLVKYGILAGDDQRYVVAVESTWASIDAINPRAVVRISPAVAA